MRAIAYLLLCFCMVIPCEASLKRRQQKREALAEIKAKEAASATDCVSYPEELAEQKLDLAKVKEFREDYLRENYTALLDDYSRFWNFVHQTWLQADESDKKVLKNYRHDHRHSKWYHQKDSRLTQERAYAEVQQQYKDDFKKFAEKYFVVEPYGIHGWSFGVRKDKEGHVFPYGSVIELAEGEFMTTRYAKVRVDEKFGGFVMQIRIRNDNYASRIKMVEQKGNFHAKKPAMYEILASARASAEITAENKNFSDSEERLLLLLDERFENCKFSEVSKTSAKK